MQNQGVVNVPFLDLSSLSDFGWQDMKEKNIFFDVELEPTVRI